MDKKQFGRKNAIMSSYFSATTRLVQYLGNIRPLLEQSDWLILVIGPSILVR